MDKFILGFSHSMDQTQLKKDIDYEVDEKNKNVILTEDGIDKAQEIIGCKDLFDINTQHAHDLLNALKAKELFIKDTDYVIKNGEVVVNNNVTYDQVISDYEKSILLSIIYLCIDY